MTKHQADAVLAALAGAFFDKSRRPSPPNMPTLRSFQRAEAEAAVAGSPGDGEAPESLFNLRIGALTEPDACLSARAMQPLDGLREV